MTQQSQIELLPHQFDAITSDAKIVLLNGGIGSGKTFTGAHASIENSQLNPNSLGLIGANTYRQLHDATIPTLLTELEKYKVNHFWKPSKGELWVGQKKFICRSLENYNFLRGIELGDFWCDETRDTKEDAYKVLLGRLRCKRARRLKGLFTTSPSGFNWLHQKFVLDRPVDHALIMATSLDNHHLPDGYIETLMGSYDPKMIQQEIMGQFVNLQADAVYYAFDRVKHVQAFTPEAIFSKDENGKIIPLPLHGGIDFNVNPMTGVVGWTTEDTIYVWDEGFYKDSNTPHWAQAMKERGYGHAELTPDSTGNKRATNNALPNTDHILLEQAGYKLKRVVNPHVDDRVNCVNGLFSRARIVIHPRCVNLIRDLEQVSRGKNDPMLTHISDALGYWCWSRFPIRRERTAIKQYSYM